MNSTTACAEDGGALPTYFPVAAARLLDLLSERCRWPLGDPASTGFDFCGHPRMFRMSYCAAHRRLACEPAR